MTEIKSNKIGIFTYLKNMFLDIFLLYKNFFHWLGVKVIIILWSIILGFLFTIPFLLIYYIFAISTGNDPSLLINGLLNQVFLDTVFGNIMFFLTIFVYIVMFLYSNILLINLYNSYISQNKIKINNIKYFDFNLIIKYFKLTLLNMLILLIPVMIFLLLIFILYITSGGISGGHDLLATGEYNYLSVISLLLFVVLVISFIYILYRIIFGYFILSDEKYYKLENSIYYYLKESIKKTKGVSRFFRLILSLLLYLIIFAPLNYLDNYLEKDFKAVKNYIILSDLDEKQLEQLPVDNRYYYESMQIEFKDFTEKEIYAKLNNSSIKVLMFNIFNFIFLYGIFIMLLTSFYRRELEK